MYGQHGQEKKSVGEGCGWGGCAVGLEGGAGVRGHERAAVGLRRQGGWGWAKGVRVETDG